MKMKPEVQNELKLIAQSINAEMFLKNQLEDAEQMHRNAKMLFKDTPVFLSLNVLEPLCTYIKELQDSIINITNRQFEMEAHLKYLNNSATNSGD